MLQCCNIPTASRAQGDGATANAIKRTSPAPIAERNLLWSFGKQPSAHFAEVQVRLGHVLQGDTFWSSEMHLHCPHRRTGFLKVFKISLWLSISSFFFKATYRLKTMSRFFHHHLDSLKMSAQYFGNWAHLHCWKQPERGPKKAGTIKETWDYSGPEKSHITDCLWKIVATLLFSRCNHTAHKSGSQNDTTQKVSVWPDSKRFI